MNGTPFDALNKFPLLPTLIRMDTDAAQSADMMRRVKGASGKSNKRTDRRPELPERR